MPAKGGSKARASTDVVLAQALAAIQRGRRDGPDGFPQMTVDEGRFYRRWVAANGLAESAGLGTTFVLGRAVAPYLERLPDSRVVLLAGAVAAVLFGMLLEGVLVGFAQERVLRDRVVGLRSGAWIVATSIGAGAAWVLGMIPSTLMSLSGADAPGGGGSEPGAMVQYGLAAVLGLVTGPVLGVAQWVVLRRVVTRAAHWLWANAVAWGLGMPLIFLGMDRVPWGGAPAIIIAALYVVCAVAGLAVGAIHGRVLVRLLRSATT